MMVELQSDISYKGVEGVSRGIRRGRDGGSHLFEVLSSSQPRPGWRLLI